MLTTEDIRLLREIVQWRRDQGWTTKVRKVNPKVKLREYLHESAAPVDVFLTGDGYELAVYYWCGDEQQGTNLWPDSTIRAMDVLAAFGVLPAKFSSAYWVGQGAAAVAVAVEAGTAAAPREATGDEPDLEQMAIDRAVEAQLDTYWANVHSLLDDEKSEMWQAFADVVEKLQPDIGPWDKRELVGAIVAEFKAVIDDAS